MSDEGDRACPLCAEEMDLTDQQLKPCKCGYEICVWCWHHIMAMAEKDQKQGRCPACRTPYNKEKIVGTTANCERLVAEMNMEKQKKSQKTKSKISDGRKQLANVRVIQKSLVYIVGLPLTLADENLLQQRDYFGQYGRVLKVSISRTAAGSIQQFANNTCSVYITYSKEEEAVRCIQSVHGFVLDDNPLRACFGTTKYCHSWLRNVPCSNPDCLYLHEFGTQEDSFTKDDTVSAFSRNRVQQITGATSNMQRRSGNVLPPPADDMHISSPTLSEKPTSKSASNNVATSVNGFPPNNSSDRSAALPLAASWGARTSNGNPPSADTACSNGLSNQKPETAAAFSTAVADPIHVPRLHAESRKKLNKKEEIQTEPHIGGQESLESNSILYSCTDTYAAPKALVSIPSPPSPKDKGTITSISPKETASVELVWRSGSPGPENNLNVSAQGNNDNLCSGIESMYINRFSEVNHSGKNSPNSSFSGIIANSSVYQELQQSYVEGHRKLSTSISVRKTAASSDDFWVQKEQSDSRQEFLYTRRRSETESDLQTVGAKLNSQVASPRARQHFEGKQITDSEFITNTSYYSTPSFSVHHSDLSNVQTPTQTEPHGSSSLIQDPPIFENTPENGLLLHPSGISEELNGYPGDMVNSYANSDKKFDHSCLETKLVGRFEVKEANKVQSVGTDMGESSIISNILSLDFDPWEESLTSPQNLVKMLGDGDKRQGPLAPSNSWKAQNSNKSRFSFARPDECRDVPSTVEPSFSHMQQVFKESSLSQNLAVNRDFNFSKFGDRNGFSTFNTEEIDNLAGSYSYLSSNNFSGSRYQVTAPPGFSSPNKAPPPGFTSHGRMGSNFDAVSGNHFLDASSLLRNPYQFPQNGNIGSSTDIEFMDPAILAVGKGRLPIGLNDGVGLDMRNNFSPQLNAVENEARFLSMMQRSSPPVQNQRFSGMGNGFGPICNTQNNHIPSRIMEQTVASNISPFSQLGPQQSRTSMMPNGHWNSWSEGKSPNDMGMAELLRSERLGFNKFYGGYEDSKFHMPSLGDLYNRTYGI